jgi:hypothetical protein
VVVAAVEQVPLYVPPGVRRKRRLTTRSEEHDVSVEINGAPLARILKYAKSPRVIATVNATTATTMPAMAPWLSSPLLEEEFDL